MIEINHLPNEALLVIFLFCVPATGRYSADTPSRLWLAFSQTCRRWRTLALSAPALWTVPSFAHRELAQAMITRSCALPLDIFYTPRDPDLPEWATVLDNAHRVREISFYADRWLLTELLNDLHPMPALRRWRLCFTPYVDEDEDPSLEPFEDEEDTPIMLRRDAFVAALPLTSLTHVEFDDYIPHPESPIYAHLTTLSITVRTTKRSFQLNRLEPKLAVCDVLHMLSQCPRLVELSLKAEVDAMTVPWEPKSPVALDCIERVRLQERLTVSLFLLTHLLIPATASIFVEGGMPLFEPTERDIDGARTTIRPRRTAEDLVRQHLEVQSRMRPGMALCALRFAESPSFGDRSLTLKWRCPDSDYVSTMTLGSPVALSDLFPLVYESLEVGAVVELDYALDTKASNPRTSLPHVRVCADALVAMPVLQSLRIVHQDASWLFSRALVEVPDACSALKQLSLLAQEMCIACGSTQIPTPTPLLALITVLRDRVRLGVGLDVLVFEGHFGWGDDGAQAVADQAVAWDGTAVQVSVREAPDNLKSVRRILLRRRGLTCLCRQDIMFSHRRCARWAYVASLGLKLSPLIKPKRIEARAPSPTDSELGNIAEYAWVDDSVCDDCDGDFGGY
jgi:hypothetical protein